MGSTPSPGAEPGRVYHLALLPEWEQARAVGRYERSTRGRSLADVGFVHCATEEQLAGVAATFYAGCPEELVVLVLDVATREGHGLPVRLEDGGDGRRYPHVYGALPVDLVRDVRPASVDGDGRLTVAW